MNSSYHEKRKKFYHTIDNFWPDLYGEEYALYDVSLINREEFDKICLISERIGRIFFKMSSLLRNTPDDTLIEMGFPVETLLYLREKTLLSESVISRLDLIRSGKTYKCIEINSDTPTFIKEIFHVNGRVCDEFNVNNPNEHMEEKLGKVVRESIIQSAEYLRTPNPYIVFTAHEDNIEDRNTVLYLQELAQLPSKFVPLHKLQIKKDVGLFDEEGKQIDVLYRQTFPVESLIEDKDDSGNQIGLWLIELIQLKKLAVINPPSAFLLQNKAVQAVIWGLHEEGHPFFTQEEHAWIEEYFLPTYFEVDYFLDTETPFVKKPVFGREGDTVEIYTSSGELALKDEHKSYSHYSQIFQQYVELPKVCYQSEKGTQEGYQLVGSFLINGRAGAVGYRVGKKITNNLSYFLPLGLKN